MSVRIFVDTVQVRYLCREPGERQEAFGFLIVDDDAQHSLLDFPSAKEIPQTLEALLEYCLLHEHKKLWDFFEGHCSFGQSVEFNDEYYNHEDLEMTLQAVKQAYAAGKE